MFKSEIRSQYTIRIDQTEPPRIPWHFWVSISHPIKYLQWRHKEYKNLRTPAPAGYCCPNCNGLLFYGGPCGGMSVNVKCAKPNCGKKYCWCGPFGMDPINNDDSCYGGLPKCLFNM